MNTQDQKLSLEEQRAAMRRAPPTLGAAAKGLTMPKRHATLADAVAARGGKQEGEGEGQGGRQGGQERPGHSSYYSPIPVGGIAMPKCGSDIGDAVVQREAAQKKRRSLSI